MWRRSTTNDQPQRQPPVNVMKLVMVGGTRSGKTAAFQQYCFDSFKRPYAQTIGIDFHSKMVEINGEKYKTQIWDTPGQESFRSVTKAYYRGTDGFFLFYNVQQRHTFDYVMHVLKEVGEWCPKMVPMVLVGTGSDVPLEDRVVTYEEGLALAESIRSPNGVPFFEISSKTNTNVDDMFHHMYEMVLKLRPCNCFKQVNWQPKLHVQCHKIQKTILKLILMKNARSFNGGARMPNAVILYIFSFLGVAIYEVQWYGIAIEESKKSTTNYRQQVNNTRNKMTCVVM